jgi:hypothetical protein
MFAKSSTFPLGGNQFGIQSPVLPYREKPLAALPTVSQPIINFITTFASDGDGTGNIHQDWGGMQKELAVMMGDGTVFCAYIQNNAGTDRLVLMRSPTGGPTSGGSWTQVATVATDFYKSIVLRDNTRDHLIWATMEGTSGSYVCNLRVYDSTGAQVGSTFPVCQAGKGIAEGLLNTGFYFNGGIGAGGTVILTGWVLPQPVALQNNTTLQCRKKVQRVKWNGSTWTADPCKLGPPGVRADYDAVLVGANGDPDQVLGLCQGNVAMWEAVSYFTPERLSPARLSGFYAFDRIGTWGYNFRTGDWLPPKWISPNIPWQIRPWDGDGSSYNASNDIPECRFKQATMNPITGDWWVPYHCIVPKPYAAGFTCTGSISGNTLTVTAVTGTPLSVGTTLTAHSLAGTGMLPTKIIALGTGTGGTGTYILDTHQTIASGTVSGCNPANPSTTQTPTSSWRIMIVTQKGDVKWDGDVLNVGYGQLGLYSMSTGKMIAVFLALGSDTTNTNCHMWALSQAADGSINTINLDLASQRNSDNNPTGNAGFGCVNAYLGGAATSPARSSNQGPIFPDPLFGSQQRDGMVPLIISRRATDHNAGATPTTTNDSTGHKMDFAQVSAPL